MRTFVVVCAVLALFAVASYSSKLPESALAVVPASSSSHAKVPFSDPCNRWPNCSSCVVNKFCGWCSNNVTYTDGSPGAQCAGPNATSPFKCEGVYSTEKCAIGYFCNITSKKCQMDRPGNGLPQDLCSQGCFPPFYSCSPINATCVLTDQEHGGIPNATCQAQCAAHNNTPDPLIGIWRGIQISAGYKKGEWKLYLDNATAALYDPVTFNLIFYGKVSWVQNYLIVTPYHGERIYIMYAYVNGPVTKWATFAISKPGANPPNSFDEAMTSATATTYVMVSCLDQSICSFASNTSSLEELKWLYRSYQNQKSKIAVHKKPTALPAPPVVAPGPPIDHCMPFKDCPSCLKSPYCGWCSTNVIYEGNIPGTQCAGFNSNSSDTAFTCFGTYSTIACPVPPPLYVCNGSTKQCLLSTNGTGSPQSACNATCGKNSTTIKYKCNVDKMTCDPDPDGQDLQTCNQTCTVQPFPVILQGTYRGIEVSRNYTIGEWTLIIASLNLTTSLFVLSTPKNITISGTMDHIASEPVLRLIITSPIKASQYAQYELANGPETAYLTLATGAAGSTAYPSFVQAMTGDGMSVLNFVSCLNPTLCRF